MYDAFFGWSSEVGEDVLDFGKKERGWLEEGLVFVENFNGLYGFILASFEGEGSHGLVVSEKVGEAGVDAFGVDAR